MVPLCNDAKLRRNAAEPEQAVNPLRQITARRPADHPFLWRRRGRSGEAYDMVKLYKPEIKWTQDGGDSIKGK